MGFGSRLAFLLVLASAAVPASAAGSISTSGATLTPGLAQAPGTVTVDPAAPAGDPPAIPEAASAGAALPFEDRYGNAYPTPNRGGGGEAWRATADAILPAGTWDLASFTVDPGVTVTFEGRTTIRTSGDVLVRGTVRTMEATSTIAFVCDGDFRVLGEEGSPTPRIHASGSTSSVVVDCLGTIEVRAATGYEVEFYGSLGVFLTSGSAAGVDTLDLHGAYFGAGAHGVKLHSRSNALLDRVRASFGYYHAAGGDLVLRGTELDGRSLATRMGATGSVRFEEGTLVRGASVEVRAAGGALEVLGGSVVESTAVPMTLEAKTGIRVAGGSAVRQLSDWAMDLVAWEGAIVVGADAATDDASSVAGKAGGPLSLRGETGVRVLPGASATCVDGDLRLDAASGAVEIRGEVSSRFGAVEVRSRDGVRVDAGVSGTPSVSGTRVALSASADGVEVAAGSLRAKAGPLSILASADVGLATSASAAGDLSIVSTGGAVRVGGATLATDAALDASGSILVESWDEEAGVVEADGSTMTTGDAIATSGDISLLVHAPAAGPGDPGPSSPAALRILGAAARGAGSGSWKVKVSGGLADLEAMGPAGGSAQVEVCGEVRELLPVGRTDGRTLRFAGTDGRLRIRLPRGEGEARVRLSWRGGLGGALDAGGTGALRVRFRACGLDAEGEAGLRAGRMR